MCSAIRWPPLCSVIRWLYSGLHVYSVIRLTIAPMHDNIDEGNVCVRIYVERWSLMMHAASALASIYSVIRCRNSRQVRRTSQKTLHDNVKNIMKVRKKKGPEIAVRLRSDLFQTCVRLAFDLF